MHLTCANALRSCGRQALGGVECLAMKLASMHLGSGLFDNQLIVSRNLELDLHREPGIGVVESAKVPDDPVQILGNSVALVIRQDDFAERHLIGGDEANGIRVDAPLVLCLKTQKQFFRAGAKVRIGD